MRARPVGDTARANWSSVLALLVGGLACLIIVARRDDDPEIGTVLTTLYLATWPAFVVIYLAWTHRTYTRAGADGLKDRAREEDLERNAWWYALFGYGGASSWTLFGAVVAVGLTVGVARSADIRSDPLYISLAILCVACSWALMVYTFALQYLRLEATSGRSPAHIDLHVEDAPRFTDYVTLAALISTMAATTSATISTRRAWSIVRTNVLLAFAFNSVIVAMMVSLLFGNLA